MKKIQFEDFSEHSNILIFLADVVINFWGTKGNETRCLSWIYLVSWECRDLDAISVPHQET